MSVAQKKNHHLHCRTLLISTYQILISAFATLACLAHQKKKIRKVTSLIIFVLHIGVFFPIHIYAQLNTRLPNNEKSTLEQERAEIRASRDVVLKNKTPDAEVINLDSTPVFSEAVDLLTKKMKRTLYKNLKCKAKFFSQFSVIKNNRSQLVSSLKKDESCVNLPNGFLLTTFSIYSKEKSLIDLQYLNTKLTALDVPEYKFSVKRSSTMFKVRLMRSENVSRLIKGARDNVELTQIVRAEGFENYGEVFVFVTADRVLMHLNIYNADTHRLVWTDAWAIDYNPKKVNFTVGLRLNMDAAGLSFTSLTTSIYSHALRTMDFGFYFDFGFYNRPNTDLTEAQLATLSVKSKIHVGFSLGGQVAFNFIETITGNKKCCEVSLHARPGILVDIPIVDSTVNASGQIVSSLLAEVNFIIPIGVTVLIQDIYVAGDYYPLLNMGSVNIGYKF